MFGNFWTEGKEELKLVCEGEGGKRIGKEDYPDSTGKHSRIRKRCGGNLQNSKVYRRRKKTTKSENEIPGNGRRNLGINREISSKIGI